MLTFRLALKNLLGAGLRTWLNVAVLAFSFFIILFYNGMMDGWDAQAKKDSVEWEFAGGQVWNANYDPLDPFTLSESHGEIGQETEALTPVFVTQASIYPKGRMVPVMLKGIPADQALVSLPTSILTTTGNEIPVIIGKRMAKMAKLEKGESVTLRWRDKNGTFDATEVTIAEIFDSNVPGIDAGQIWIDHSRLTTMMGTGAEATYYIASADYQKESTPAGWEFKDLGFLMFDIDQMIASKKGSAGFIYMILLTLALLAIFDTQVLSIFRRQKEIGTYIALGMTRRQVMGLFTIEGGANSLLAVAVGGILGLPLLWSMATNGIPVPSSSANAGITIADKIYPVYGMGLVLGTTALMVISATIVSFIPARKIAKMDPTAALKGKIQ